MTQAESASRLPGFLHKIAGNRELMVPVGFLALIGVLVVPLHPTLLDLLICANISLAAVVLLTTIQMKRPLEFSVFPALLLATTLFRLVLNVASTRLILSAEGGSAEEMKGVAGYVIDAFANFVAGNDAIVGGIIFLILVVVQFVVITKGATRMSEVAARFTLDAMPGKQMAIDADLSSGLISESDARERRDEVMREADFYGAMDGASKFVRGDAIAGIVITLVNVIGGVAIGILDNGLTAGQALTTFGLLAIGDGLVSQIPAFVVAIAAGLIVARAGGGKTIGAAIPSQLTSQPTAMVLISIFLAMLAFTGLPSLPLLASASVLALLAFASYRKQRSRSAPAEVQPAGEEVQQTEDDLINDLLGVETMELVLGYGLVQLVDTSRGGSLVERIAHLRRDLAAEMGIVLPGIRIRDEVHMASDQYRLRIRGSAVAEGVVHPNMMMAMDTGVASGELQGLQELEPCFGKPVTWVDMDMAGQAENANYVVVDSISVIITHLKEVAMAHAGELLTREEVSKLVDQLKEKAPKLVEETVPSVIKPGDLQKVLQGLLNERIPIRDLETIVETLSDWAPRTTDQGVLVEYVRDALKRTICSQYAIPDEQGANQINCVMMDPELEDRINGYIDRSTGGTTISIPSELAGAIGKAAAAAVQPLVEAGLPPVIVASPLVRAQVRQIVQPFLADVVVLGYTETVVPGVGVESIGLVQLLEAPAPVPA